MARDATLIDDTPMRSQCMRGALLLCGAAIAGAQVCAQGTARAKEFEVVSIRDVRELSMEEYRKVDPRARLPQISGGSVRMPYESMERILQRAFGLARTQVIAPEWTNSRYFSIAAKMPDGATQDDIPEMLRNMLLARFHMGYHTEVRNTPALVLTLAKSGIKAEAAVAQSRPQRRSIGRLGGHYELATTSAGLADFLHRLTAEPVVDRTGLLDSFLFSFDFYPFGKLGEDGRPLEPASGDFVTDQARHCDDALAPLGLRVALSKVPLENVIIDQLGRAPTEN
jgi:uncharacterized protein (TIGR03435 family)